MTMTIVSMALSSHILQAGQKSEVPELLCIVRTKRTPEARAKWPRGAWEQGLTKKIEAELAHAVQAAKLMRAQLITEEQGVAAAKTPADHLHLAELAECMAQLSAKKETGNDK